MPAKGLHANVCGLRLRATHAGPQVGLHRQKVLCLSRARPDRRGRRAGNNRLHPGERKNMGRKPTGKAGKTRRRSGTAGRSSNTENTGAEAGAESATAPDPAQVETGPDGAGAEAGSGPAEGGPRMETFDRLTPEPNVDTPPNDQVSELLAEANAGLAAAPADIELHQLEQGAQLAAGPDPAEGWKPFTDNTVSIVA